MSARVRIAQWIAGIRQSPFATYADVDPWELTASAASIILGSMEELTADWKIADSVAVHRSARVEKGAVLKPPIVLGPNVLVARTAYLRGGVWLDSDCVVGPACELKSTFVFNGSKLAHLSFVGDSIIGANVNLEAGAIIANHRNELNDKRIRIRHNGGVIDTGVEKFGALVGDSARIGANAVLAPGTVIERGAIVPRLALIDQSAS